MSHLSQIEVKLKKRDGIRWATLEANPTTSEVAQQPMPEGMYRIEHVLEFAILRTKPTIFLSENDCHLCH
jgi:hypothetical protein